MSEHAEHDTQGAGLVGDKKVAKRRYMSTSVRAGLIQLVAAGSTVINPNQADDAVRDALDWVAKGGLDKNGIA